MYGAARKRWEQTEERVFHFAHTHPNPPESRQTPASRRSLEGQKLLRQMYRRNEEVPHPKHTDKAMTTVDQVIMVGADRRSAR